MASSWANKFHNRWFVRVDGKGIPVYGSLISRSIKPSQGRWIEVIIPNQICCETGFPPVVATATGTFEVDGTVQYTLSNENGQIFFYSASNSTTAATSLSALASLLTTEFPGFGTFTADATTVTLTNPLYENLTATVTFIAEP